MKTLKVAVITLTMVLMVSSFASAEPSKISQQGNFLTMGDVWFGCYEPEPICARPAVLVCRKKTLPIVLWMRQQCDSLRCIMTINRTTPSPQCGSSIQRY